MEFKQAENKASKHVLRKIILSRYHKSYMVTEIRLQFGRHIFRLDQKHCTTSYKGLMRPILVNTPETKLSKI